MMTRDLRSFIDKADSLGMLQVVEGADWNLEIGALSQLMEETPKNPILLFDKISGYPPGFRVLANHQNTAQKVALVMDIPVELNKLDIAKEILKRRRGITGIPPRSVKNGPVLDNSALGENVNLFDFPTPKWRTLEGGRYIGTSNLVINRDPDEGWVNVGCYRQMIHDEKTVGFYVEPHHHGILIARKYWAKGQACPVVACYGQAQELFRAAVSSAPWGSSEFDVAGGIAGEAIDVVQGELTGLPIPAHAEIAIEGEVPPPDDESRMEGPYREWPGYYTQDLAPQPVIRVKAVYHRNDPILLGPPGAARHISSGSVTPAALAVLEALERTALPGIRGVWAHCNGLFIVIAVEQQFAGHAKMALLTAVGARGTTSAYRYYVAVDDDIDPTNLQDVLWAMTTRCDPENQIDIVRGTTSALIDPIISPQKRAHKDLTCGRVLIDACKPWAWIEDFGKSTTFTPEYELQIRGKYAELLRQNGLPETAQ